MARRTRTAPLVDDLEPEVDVEWRLRWLRRLALFPASVVPPTPELVAAVERADRAGTDADRLAAVEDVLAAAGLLDAFDARLAGLRGQRERWGGDPR